MSTEYLLSYRLSDEIQSAIGRCVEMRHTDKNTYRKAMHQLLEETASSDQEKTHIETELAIRLAKEAQRWAKNRPLSTSWRGYSLGTALVTDKWIYDAYNMKPLPDTASEERGMPKVRICAEQQAIVYANDQDDVNFQLIVLAGVHHNDGMKELPKPCVACLRLFTSIPNHRDIDIILVHSITDERQHYTLGEIIDHASLEKVECECCHSFHRLTAWDKLRNAIFPARMEKLPDLDPEDEHDHSH